MARKTNLIAVEEGGRYAPGCYIICRVFKQQNGSLYWNEMDEKNTILCQVDYDRCGFASTFGWNPKESDGCTHGRTDGTVDCPDCGKTAGEFIEEATEFLDECASIAKTVEDPGYFTKE